jgi:hypothetical protein
VVSAFSLRLSAEVREPELISIIDESLLELVAERSQKAQFGSSRVGWARSSESIPQGCPCLLRMTSGLSVWKGSAQSLLCWRGAAKVPMVDLGCPEVTLELRATASLARQLAKQGKRDDARAILAEIYGWFTQGFDTRDLRDANALLEKLTT